MSGPSSPLRRILFSALAALAVGVAVATLVGGFSPSSGVRLLQGLAVLAAGAVLIGAAALLVMLRLAGWRDPEAEQEFEAIVRRSEELAARGPALADASTEEGFNALVRAALEELPLEFHAALEHVAVVISDGGRRQPGSGRMRVPTTPVVTPHTTAPTALPRPASRAASRGSATTSGANSVSSVARYS